MRGAVVINERPSKRRQHGHQRFFCIAKGGGVGRLGAYPEHPRIADELTYLEQHHKVELQAPLAAAIKAKDAATTAALLNRAYKAEIERRLEGASQNLGDYQTAKVLVVKSKRFLDLILPSLSEGDRKAAEQALAKVLDAIGNPGVFGVGAKPADAAAFSDAEKALMAVLAPL